MVICLVQRVHHVQPLYYYKKKENNKCYVIEHGEKDTVATVDTMDKGVYCTCMKKIKKKRKEKKRKRKRKRKRRLHGPAVFCPVQRVHRVQPLYYYYYCTRMGYLLPHSQYWYDTPHFTTMS